jgi:PAS domain S-box-containing protein
MIRIDLVYNLAVLVAISVLSGFIDNRWKRDQLIGKIAQGLLFGFATIIGMLYPMHFAEGIIFDGRSMVISLSALFFGPVTGLIASIMAAVYRFWIGGAGTVMGISVIGASYLIGSVFFYTWKHHKTARKLNVLQLYFLGILVHAAMLLLILTLPSGYRFDAINVLGLTIIGVYPIVTVIIGKILQDQELNQALFSQTSKNEKLFRTTFYSIGDAVITTDKYGNVMQMNHMAENLTGFDEAEAHNKPLQEIFNIVNENTGLTVDNPVKLVLEKGQVIAMANHTLLITKQGNRIPISDSGAPIIDEDGVINGVVLVFRDQRLENQSRVELSRSLDSFHGLFNSVTNAIYIQDSNGLFLAVNEGAVAMYGYPRDYFIGKTPEFLSAPGKNDLTKVKYQLEEAFKGYTQRFEFWGIRKNGEEFPKEVNLFKTNYFGQDAVIAIAQDITERRKADDALKESEARYRLLFDSSPVGILLEDENGTILEVNKTICKQYGYEADELIGQSVEIFSSSESRSLVKNNIHKILEYGALETILTGFQKNGTPIVIQLIETKIKLEDGKSGVLSISQDITEQRKTEESLAITEERNKAIISAIPDILFRFNRQHQFIDCVAKSPEQLYKPVDQFMGKSADEVLPLSLAKHFNTQIEEAFKTGQLLQFEYDIEVGGRLKWYEGRMVQSGLDEVLLIVRDITERKESEIELVQKTRFIETLLDSIPNPLFYMNVNGIYLGVNKAFREFYGKMADEIVGKTLFEFETPEIAERNFEADRRILQGIDKKQVIERVIYLPDGQTRNTIITKSPFPDNNDQIGGLIGLLIDITSRKVMEKELLDAKERAEESDKLKTSFLNNLSHEIRTPLNAIVGFSDLLFEDYTGQQKRQFVETINHNADQLLRIIDDVLVVSRLDSEKIPLEKNLVDIQQLLDDVYITFRPEAEKAGLELNKAFVEADVPALITADRAKIRQVLTGFVGNAIKYTKLGEIAIGCSRLTQPDQSDWLHFYVSDTGMGVPVYEQSYVFNRFFRSTKAQLHAIRGNGLGLSIAKGLVDLMGGKIGLHSTEDQGSTFYFDLPIELPGNTPKSELEGLTNTHQSAIRNIRILLVEDEKDNADLIVSMLEPYVKHIDQASNGIEALDMVRNHSYNIVLMDIKMPLMDGIETVKKIREFDHELTVIAQTAYAQQDEIKRILHAGCNDYLIKPLTLKKVLEVISRYCSD